MLGLPMMLLVELALQHCICTFASYRECAASAKHRAHVRPQCPAHARMVLRGGGDEGVRDILQALPDSVRGLVGALGRAGVHGDDDEESQGDASETLSDFPARRRNLSGREQVKRAPAAPPGNPPNDDDDDDGDGDLTGELLPPADDADALREADTLDRALRKWRANMEDRAKNPRISLMV